MEAYLRGLEALVAADRSHELAHVASVASFFVSRFDTEVDRRLESLAGGAPGDPAVLALRGSGAVAQAQTGLSAFPPDLLRRALGGLAGQRCPGPTPAVGFDLDEEPGYPDLLYVDSLIGPASVNTMPDGTLRGFEDHGTLHADLDADPEGGRGASTAARGGGRHASTWSRPSRTRA